MAATDDFIISVLCSGPGEIPQNAKTSYNIAVLTAANFAATMTALGNLATAYAPLTLGVLSQESANHSIGGSTSYPANPANRGSKWIVTSQDTHNNLYTHTIPAYNLGTSNVNVNADGVTASFATGSAWPAYKTAFEAICVSPASDALTLVRAKTGGRRR